MRGLIDNSVNIGGDQVITGVKTIKNGMNFNSNIAFSTSIDFDTIPDTSKNSNGIEFYDVQNRRIGKFQAQQNTSGYTGVSVITNNKSSDVNCSIRPQIDTSNNTRVYSEGISGGVNTALITAARSINTASGYYKLGELILCWGTIDSSDDHKTFATPFSEVPQCVVTASPSNGSTSYSAVLNSGSTTKTTIYVGKSNNVTVRFFAIGK